MIEFTDEQENEMRDAYAVLEFKRYLDRNYLSDALHELAEMMDNPIKREQLHNLSFEAFHLEESKNGVCS